MIKISKKKKEVDDALSLLKPDKEVLPENLTPEQKLIHNIQSGLFDVFRKALTEYGIEKVKESYPIWKEQWEKWKEKVNNWYQKGP